MSVQAFYQKTPDIPPEIWSTIIRYAADSGSGLYEYEMTPSEHADFLRGEEKAQMEVYHTNFCTRSYLARVNKAWYEMAAPFLFEYIHLADARELLPLCKALLRSKEIQASNGSGCSLGWRTKRLDLHMKEPCSDMGATIAQLAEMVSCFPNLSILTFSAYERDYDPQRMSLVLDAVSGSKSLKMIHWYTLGFWPSIDAWTAFLEHHPSLQSVRGPRVVRTKNHIVLNSLEALHLVVPWVNLEPDTMELSACNLPSLHCLSCHDRSPPSDQFLHTVGKQLSIFQINDTFILAPTRDFASEYGPALSLMQNICFNLVEIKFYIFFWPSFRKSYAHALFFPQSLKTLGIQFVQDYVSADEVWELLQNTFPLVIFNNTSIKTIQFLTQMNVESLRGHPEILMDGVQLLASLGVVLKDHNCRGILESES